MCSTLWALRLSLIHILCGYLFSRRALRPVAQITQTVQNIQQERDLSKRVRLGEGRDEIYTLAQTFDSLLAVSYTHLPGWAFGWITPA